MNYGHAGVFVAKQFPCRSDAVNGEETLKRTTDRAYYVPVDHPCSPLPDLDRLFSLGSIIGVPFSFACDESHNVSRQSMQQNQRGRWSSPGSAWVDSGLSERPKAWRASSSMMGSTRRDEIVAKKPLDDQGIEEPPGEHEEKRQQQGVAVVPPSRWNCLPGRQ
jgi:hypothetical protein